MRYALWIIKRKIAYTRHIAEVSVLLLIEDIKDYIFEGRERNKDARGQ
jgi:hypothetical protein